MAGKITNDGRKFVGENINIGLGVSSSTTEAFTHLEIGTGSTGATVTDSGIETALATGGRVAATSGYPKVTFTGTVIIVEVMATFAAGTFTTGTPITEAAWVDSLGTVCAGRGILDASKDPTAAEPLTVTAKFELVAN